MGTKQTTKTVGSIRVSGLIRNIGPKTIAAVVLAALMAVLWGRVFLRSRTGPTSANAATTIAAGNTRQENVKPEIRIRAIPLAVVAGRHDTIAVDFFRADRCSMYSGDRQSSSPHSPRLGENPRMLDELSKAFALEAIIKNAQGNAEKACINGTVVAVGSTLQVQVRNEMYAVQVAAIEPTRVRLSWRDYTLTLEMPDQGAGW